jgi:hypothetical protein
MRILQPGETPRADETTTTFQNTAPHVKHISIGDGAFVTVPPTVGIATVTVACTATEQAGLDKGLTTDCVLEWIAQAELVVVPPTPPPPEGGDGGDAGGVLATDPDAGGSHHRSRRGR